MSSSRGLLTNWSIFLGRDLSSSLETHFWGAGKEICFWKVIIFYHCKRCQEMAEGFEKLKFENLLSANISFVNILEWVANIFNQEYGLKLERHSLSSNMILLFFLIAGPLQKPSPISYFCYILCVTKAVSSVLQGRKSHVLIRQIQGLCWYLRVWNCNLGVIKMPFKTYF